MKVEDIINAGKFGTAKEVVTKFGNKLVRTSESTPKLSEMYKASKEEMKTLGFSYSKNSNGDWVCNIWSDIPKEVKECRKESLLNSTKSTTDFKAIVPSDLTLYPFQNAGVEYMLNRKNILLADEMGLGKTVQAIAYINQHNLSNIIIVCPKSLVLNWRNELNEWLINKNLTITIANGSIDKDANITIINYELLKKWEDVVIKDREYDLIICDEAHNIKNEKTQKSKYVKSIKTKRNIRITGTPICNRPKELFNIVTDLDDRFGNWWNFAKRYCNATKTKYGWDFSGSSNLDELQTILRETVMLRRLKADVLKDLPSKNRQIVELKSNHTSIKAEQKYLSNVEKTKEDLILKVQLSKLSDNKEEYTNAVNNLKSFNKAQFTEIAKLRHETALAKVDDIVELISEQLEEDENKKVIVACHHQDVILQYIEKFEKYNPVSITGSTKTEDRQINVEKFQNDVNCRVFIASIQAAGVGITLTSSDWVVFAELDFVPANMMQMEDRAHRIGQENNVLIQHIVLENSIDSKLVKTLILKQEIIEKALDRKIEVNNESQEEQNEVEIIENGLDSSIVYKTTYTEIEKLSKEKEYTEIEKIELLKNLRKIASNDYDNATEKNNIGFNKFDSRIGHELSCYNMLSNKQAVIVEKLVKKYRKQL